MPSVEVQLSFPFSVTDSSILHARTLSVQTVAILEMQYVSSNCWNNHILSAVKTLGAIA
jgi:hypothetical protein